MKAAIHLFNTLSGKKELLKKPTRGHLRLFVCGPTVYDTPHIGNARTYVFFDSLAKYLRAKGFRIFYLQNITDIDDKIINRAHAERVSWIKIAKTYFDLYRRNMKALGVDSVSKYAKATDYIPQIINQVGALIRKGHAYEIPSDGIYFDIASFKGYGKLSRRTALQAEDSVSRIDESINKRNKGDFALWKLSKENEPSWPSPFGAGRPGWHIEDTAITDYYFGPQYDLHGGANDLKFPHHEAEIAQAEAASGKEPMVKMWVHSGFLTLNGQKMSKSLGNFMTIDQFLKTFSPQVFRTMILSSHYRSPLDFTRRLGQENYTKWLSILEFLVKLDLVAKKAKGSSRDADYDRLKVFGEEFQASLADDFNTPRALAALFDLMTKLNPKIWTLPKTFAKKVSLEVRKNLKALGFRITPLITPKRVSILVKRREELRKNQQFMQSDGLRKKINDLGFLVEDTPLGPFVWPKT